MASVSKENRKKKAIEITVELIKEIGPMVQGVHLMPMGWSDVVPQIIEEIGEMTETGSSTNGRFGVHF